MTRKSNKIQPIFHIFSDTKSHQFQWIPGRSEPRFWQSHRDERLIFTNPLDSVSFTKNIKNEAKNDSKSLQKLIKNRLKIDAEFGMRFGSEKVSKMTPKREPNKSRISSPRPLKLEKTRYFRISISKILEKTRYFCISDPTGPLKASKCQF